MKYIYRICNKVESTNWAGVTKTQCLKNFLSDTDQCDVVIIADNCTEELINYLKKKNFMMVLDTKLGNSKSFEKALEIALEFDDNEIVYFVEDDYLHKKNWKEILKEGLSIADFVTLYDHPDKYITPSPNPFVQYGGELSRVLLTQHCHWKETNSTTMTFATTVKTLRKYEQTIRKYLDTDKPRDYLMWRDILYDSRLVSPIPGYSTHCHAKWITPFWKD